MRCRLAGHGRRGTFSSLQGVRRECGLYALQARRAWQARHFLDTRGGAQGVRSPCVAGSQGAAGVALSRHHRVCAGSAVSMRCRLAGHGRCGTFSTPQGVRRECGLYALQARRARQAWHFLDTTWGCAGSAVSMRCRLAGGGRRGTSWAPEGVRSLCVAGSHGTMGCWMTNRCR